MTATVGKIINLMESIAPSGLSESWDNCGLQVGHKEWQVSKIVVALDPLHSVMDYCCSVNADMLITHHPLIFKPLKTIDFSTPVGRIIETANTNKVAVYSAHTNYDSVCGGLNDTLAEMIGVRDVRVLSKPISAENYKLMVFTPVEHKEAVLEALFKTQAGVIRDYSCCTFSSPGTGTYKPGDNSIPYKGSAGEISSADEVRIETIVKKSDVNGVIEQVKSVHPYETLAYDVYPLADTEANQGIGRIGTLSDPVALSEFAMHVKQILGLRSLKIAGNPDMRVSSVALCTGSGSGLMKAFVSSGADVYVSGDLHYHDARTAEDTGRSLIDIGHFASEIIMAGALAERLRRECAELGYTIDIDSCPVEKDPFIIL